MTSACILALPHKSPPPHPWCHSCSHVCSHEPGEHVSYEAGQGDTHGSWPGAGDDGHERLRLWHATSGITHSISGQPTRQCAGIVGRAGQNRAARVR